MGGKIVGYAYYGVLAVDPEKYSKKDLKPWFDEWEDYFDDVIYEKTRTVFIVNWAKGGSDVFEDFVENYADRDKFKNLDTEGFGYIILGEEDADIEYFGEPWEFDINLSRSIEVY
jgi:hypothetical protein